MHQRGHNNPAGRVSPNLLQRDVLNFLQLLCKRMHTLKYIRAREYISLHHVGNNSLDLLPFLFLPLFSYPLTIYHGLLNTLTRRRNL